MIEEERMKDTERTGIDMKGTGTDGSSMPQGMIMSVDTTEGMEMEEREVILLIQNATAGGMVVPRGVQQVCTSSRVL
jgi:hypothetical protein